MTCGHRNGPWICIGRVRCFGRHYYVKADPSLTSMPTGRS
jgi:hypothetical protein